MNRLTLRKLIRSYRNLGPLNMMLGILTFALLFLFFVLDLCGALRLLSRTEVTALYQLPALKFATIETRKLGPTDVCKDFWDCYYRRGPSNDPRKHCATHFGPSSLRW